MTSSTYITARRFDIFVLLVKNEQMQLWRSATASPAYTEISNIIAAHELKFSGTSINASILANIVKSTLM